MRAIRLGRLCVEEQGARRGSHSRAFDAFKPPHRAEKSFADDQDDFRVPAFAIVDGSGRSASVRCFVSEDYALGNMPRQGSAISSPIPVRDQDRGYQYWLFVSFHSFHDEEQVAIPALHLHDIHELGEEEEVHG